MDENRYLNVIIFERLIRNTPNVIVMDALLSGSCNWNSRSGNRFFGKAL